MNRETLPTNLDISFIKERALKYVETGNLTTALDSIVSDLNKDPNRAEEQKQLIADMAWALKSDPNLSREQVVEFIEGF